jgi:hypothetical protein
MPPVHPFEEAYVLKPDQLKKIKENLSKADCKAALTEIEKVFNEQRYWNFEATCSATPIRF